MANLQQIINNLSQQVGWAAGQARDAQQKLSNMQGDHALIRQELTRQHRELQTLAQAMNSVNGGGGGPGGAIVGAPGGRTQVRMLNDEVRYLDEIPGRRIPFDFLTQIPIGANVTAEQPGTEVVSQDGPFVAVARFATFQSAYQFSRTDPESGATAAFQGRSFGRFRPIHSAWDVSDAGNQAPPTFVAAIPGTGAPLIASATNHSTFRTMEWDGVIEFLNQGAAYPRSNMQVPSSFWTTQINSPFQLGALDFFERGESLQWKATPTHVNNPDAGNLSGYGVGGTWPFLDSQYDIQEGISDPEILAETTDPITRLPDGILIIGLHGFRIVQPPGPVAMT